MTVTASRLDSSAKRSAKRAKYPFYSSLVGLAALVVLLQGLWAGIFLEHDGERDSSGKWIDVHARGGEVALVLAAAATVVAWVKIRERTDLWLGALALTVLLIIEAYIGGLIRDSSMDTLTAVHVPLGMAIMGLSVWLPFRGAASRPHHRGVRPNESAGSTRHRLAGTRRSG
jgi:hypothetical protein